MIHWQLQRNVSVCRADPVAFAGANDLPYGMSSVNLTCAQLDSSWRSE
jgi:hypothetical protein